MTISDISNIIQCSYNEKTNKIVFSLVDDSYKFDLDFVLKEGPDRDIAENLGWLLGYHKPYYSFDTKFVDGKRYDAAYKEEI